MITLFAFLFGGSTVLLFFHFKNKGLHRLGQEILAAAEREITKKRNELEKALLERELAQSQKFEEEKRKLGKEEEKLSLREEKLESKLQGLIKKLSEIEKKDEELKGSLAGISEDRQKILEELHRVSKMSVEEAKEELLKRVELDLLKRQKRVLEEFQENIEKESAKLIATSLNRLALPLANEITTTTVAIPNDEMKGRVIGREGRNIRCLEMATGVNFVVDEVPGAIVLSSFDPVRKHIAKTALIELIQDGRIHPTRIEELVEKAKISVERHLKEKGEAAVLGAGILPLHPELTKLLGRLSLQYSYGQNILLHSIEVAQIMGIMADELKLDSSLARRIGLCHDIGKAVTHEIGGSHAILGHDLAIKYGENEWVANGIGCHHHEMPPLSIEGSLCSSADQISGGRIGARSEAIEQYVRRLGKLEMIASQYPGVEKAYALQAGREVRVIVLPEMIDDDQLHILARHLASRIEKELIYPGKIKITVIREKKAVEYAS